MHTLSKQEKIRLVVEAIQTLIESSYLEEQLTHRGQFRKTLPKNAHPLVKYVHRMIQFSTGQSLSIPTQTQFFLQDFVDIVLQQTMLPLRDPKRKEQLTVYIIKDGIEKMYNMLDSKADELATHFGLKKVY